MLKEKIDLVIFDEGHKEPADEWQTVIRSLNKKVILFTATPVRNDHNKFKIDPEYIFSYTFQDARKQEFIRDIKFDYLRSDESQDVISFANKLYERYERYLQEEGLNANDVKVIVRCGNAEDIKKMVDALKIKSSVVGIHDEFKNSKDEFLIDQVPQDIRSSNVIFWVHQYKLIEGIDNYQFSLLGIYESLPDPRSFIQQVGRVIRIGGQSRNAIVLLRDSDKHQKAWWDSYLDFEYLISLNPTELIFKYENYFKSILDANPTGVYLDRKFLKRFSLNIEGDVKSKLEKYQVPKKANLFKLDEDVDDVKSFIEVMLETISGEYAELDYLILDKLIVEDKQSACIVYSTYENSNILVGESFLEVKLGISILRVLGNHLYYYDSHNSIPSCVKNNYKKVSAKQLKRLFGQEENITSMSIRNGSINFNSFNRMILNSDDISKMVPNVTDKYNLCTTLTGSRKVEKRKPSLRRYVGFTNARISQETYNVSLINYFHWIDEINSIINNATRPEHEIFHRFAPITDIPDIVTPTLILFHFDSDEVSLVTTYDSATDLDKKYYKISNSTFSLMWDDKSYEVKITFSQKTGKYKLEYADPSKAPKLFVKGKKRKVDFIEWLNEEQDFQLIIKGNKYRYHKNVFYKVGIPAEYSAIESFLDEYELLLTTRVKKFMKREVVKILVLPLKQCGMKIRYFI